MAFKNIFACVFFGAALLFGICVTAGHTDYSVKATIDIQGSAAAHGVSVDNRFVFSVDKDANRLFIIDTWNWRMVNPLGSDTIHTGGAPTDLAVSRGGKYIYVSRADGKVRRFDISGLEGLGFDKGLESLETPISWQTLTISAAGDNLSDIEVLRQQGNPEVDCLFVANEAAQDLNWFLLDDTGVIDQGIVPLIAGQPEIELASGNNAVFAKFFEGSVNNRIYAFQCVTGVAPIIEYNTANNYGAEALQGLAANKSTDRLVVGNADTSEIWLFNTLNLGGISVIPSDTIKTDAVPEKLLLTDFDHENYPIVFVAGGDSLFNTPLHESLIEFQGLKYMIDHAFGAPPLLLAQSGSNDEYIYASPEGSASIFVVTANPWVSSLQTDPASPIESNTVRVSFHYDDGADCVIKRTEGFKDTGTQLSGGPLTLPDQTVWTDISTDGLVEGWNIIEVNVMDAAGRTGRNAIAAKVDRPPPGLDFELYFGDEKLIIRFRSLDLPDIAYYEFYYGTNGEVPRSSYEQIDDTGLQGEPSSPFRISDPARNRDYEQLIEGVENGVVYYVQAVTADDTGHLSVSARKSAVPQPVGSITDRSGEEGGFDCFEQIAPGGGSGGPLLMIWALLAPLVFMGAARLMRRFSKK